MVRKPSLSFITLDTTSGVVFPLASIVSRCRPRLEKSETPTLLWLVICVPIPTPPPRPCPILTIDCSSPLWHRNSRTANIVYNELKNMHVTANMFAICSTWYGSVLFSPSLFSSSSFSSRFWLL